MPDFIEKQRITEKEIAVEVLDGALVHIESQVREPDPWEIVSLYFGIAALFRGMYMVATMAGENVILPKTGRGDLPIRLPSEMAGFGLEQLKQALTLASAEPVRSHPHFGIVSFVGEVGAN